MNPTELIQKRNQIVTQARAILEKAEAEKRSLTAEERSNYDKAMKDVAELKGDIDRAQQMDELQRSLSQSQGRRSEPTEPGTGGENRGQTRKLEYRGVSIELKPEQRGYGRASDEYRTAFAGWMRTGELRTAAAFANDVDADGGYLHSPYQMVLEIMKAKDGLNFVRAASRVFPVTGTDSLGVPTMGTRPGDADWKTEVQSTSADEAAQLSVRELKPNISTKLFKVSRKLMLTSAISPDQIVNEEMAALFARTEEKAFLSGDGSGKPLGVFTASASGVSTGRDVSTSNLTTSVTFDGLISAKYKVGGQYRNGAIWIFHRDGVAQISKLKDGDGQYIWQPSKAMGEPDMLLGHPLRESEYAPNTFTTGQYVGIFGNFAYYWIVDLLGLEMQRLVELYAATNQIGFIGRAYTDGQPVLEDAFARVKLG